jgi:hypothetical protein
LNKKEKKINKKSSFKKPKKKGEPWFMNILDKTIISKTRFCPPHYFPHKLPVGEKIVDEPCHFHNAKWRMGHHKPFCKLLKCPNNKFMLGEYEKFVKKKKYQKKN